LYNIYNSLSKPIKRVLFQAPFTQYNLLSNRLTVKPVVKPVWQPVVSCIQTFNDNRFDNRLYRVYSRSESRRHIFCER